LKMISQAQPSVSSEDARKMSMNQLGLEKAFFGRVDKLGTKFHLSVKLEGLDLGVEQMESGAAESEEQLPDAVNQLAAVFLMDNSPEAIAQRGAAKAEKERQAAAQNAEAQAKEEARRKASPFAATKDSPWTNTLGMVFVPVPGTSVLFSIWDTRVKDYRAYASAAGGVNNRWQSPGFSQGDDHPVVNASWNDAQAFCQWLTEKERGEGKLKENQSYRLPREVEWNQAVGNTTFPWDEQWPPPNGAGNYGQSNYPFTSPVGSFKPNPFGLYDLGGNVRQWCEDRYDDSPQFRVLRGASWLGGDRDTLLSSYRNGSPAHIRGSDVGYRCVLAAIDQTGEISAPKLPAEVSPPPINTPPSQKPPILNISTNLPQ